MLAAARRDPARLFIGIDANLGPLAEASSRAMRKPARGGAPNAWFVRAAAEALPPELAGTAGRITVLLPWGSLLAALLEPDSGVLRGLRDLARPQARLEAVVSLDTHDTTERPLDEPSMARLLGPYRAAGWRLRSVTPLDARALAAVGTTWAGRLAHGRGRPAWRLVATTDRSLGPGGAHFAAMEDLVATEGLTAVGGE